MLNFFCWTEAQECSLYNMNIFCKQPVQKIFLRIFLGYFIWLVEIFFSLDKRSLKGMKRSLAIGSFEKMKQKGSLSILSPDMASSKWKWNQSKCQMNRWSKAKMKCLLVCNDRYYSLHLTCKIASIYPCSSQDSISFFCGTACLSFAWLEL